MTSKVTWQVNRPDGWFPQGKGTQVLGEANTQPNGREFMPEPEKLIPPHGGYRKLKSFQVAQLVYDVTVRFCDRYIGKRSRTHDQMVQAARSGVQNIAEGSQASGTSKRSELKLTNVARASLEKAFVEEGGFTERLYKVRSERRSRG